MTTATISSPWSKPGAWALDAEEQEAELQKQTSSVTKLAEFPSLSAAATTKTKKKKGQTISLAEFATYGSAKPSEPTRLTHEEVLALPTGPRQRAPEELDRDRLGGGFKSYGSNRYNSNGDDSVSNSRWGSSRVSNRESVKEITPSRADEIDNWASAKKSTPTRNGFGGGFGGGFERRERGGGGGGFFDSQSRADEVDNWASNKSVKSPNAAPPRRFGGGFERRTSFDSLQSRDLDNWGKKETGSTAGSSIGGSRPRLVLQPRTVPVTEEPKKEVTLTRSPPKPRGANPFGEARPREEVLKEKGQDWKEIDEKLEAVKLKETVTVAEKERGRKSSFGNGHAPVERSWRKNVSVEAAADAEQPQSSETENGHVTGN